MSCSQFKAPCHLFGRGLFSCEALLVPRLARPGFDTNVAPAAPQLQARKSSGKSAMKSGRTAGDCVTSWGFTAVSLGVFDVALAVMKCRQK